MPGSDAEGVSTLWETCPWCDGPMTAQQTSPDDFPDRPVKIDLSADLQLRTPEPKDEPEITRACADPDIATYTEVPAPYTPAHAREYVQRVVPARLHDRSAVILTVADAADDVMGMVSLHDLDGFHRGAIGFWIAPWARGRGLAVASVRGLVRWGFERLGLTHITWTALVGNLASLRVAQAAGFVGEGRLSGGVVAHGGEPRDCWTASIFAASPLVGPFSRPEVDVEIAAGMWQLQPIEAAEVGFAETVLPVPCNATQAIWIAKEITTAEPQAAVALLGQSGGRGWVLSAPRDESDRQAAVAARDAVTRYGLRALGMDLL